MPSGGFSNRIRARSRRGARLEPRHGWSLGVKTSRAPDGAGSPDPEETPDERSARVADEERRRGRASDAMDRKDRADLGIGADDDVPGMPLVRRRRGGMEPRTAHHGDPVEDRRASYSPSTSVWAQDPRAEHLREEARDTEWDRRMGFEGEAAVRSLRSAVVDGAQALVSLRWGPLTDRSIPNAAEVEYQQSKPRLDDDGSRPRLVEVGKLRAEHRDVVPPLGPSLAHVGCDPALVALAAGRYARADLEPPVFNPVTDRVRDGLTEIQAAEAGIVLPDDEHSQNVQAAAIGILERALSDLDQRHLELCGRDPRASLAAERAWAAERRELLDRVADRSDRPEDGRALVAAMEEHHEAQAPQRDAARYLARVHLAAGRDPVDDRASDERLSEILAHQPSLVAGIRELDPDSPLVVVPPGVDADGQYEHLLSRVLDDARSEALARGVGPFVPSPGALAVSVASACASRHEEGERDPFLPAGRVRTAPQDALAGAAGRLAAFVDGCRHLTDGAAPGAALPSRFPVRVRLEPQAGRVVARVDLAKGVEPEDVAAEAHIIARSVFPALAERSSSPLPEDARGRAVAQEVFATRVSARVSGLPVDDVYLDEPDRFGPDHTAGVSLVGEVRRASSESARALVLAVDRYEAATDRFAAVVSALEAEGVVVRRSDAVPHDPAFVPTVALEGDAAVVDLGSSVPLDRPDQLSVPELVDSQAKAYVVLGRASALTSRGGDRASDFRELHADGPSTSDARFTDSSGAPSAAALREQVVADFFATDQLDQAWGDASQPLRRVDRGPDGGPRLEVPAAQRSAWPAELDDLVAADGKHVRADGNRVSSWLDRVVKRRSEDNAPQPAAAPAPASAARAAADRVPDRAPARQ